MAAPPPPQAVTFRMQSFYFPLVKILYCCALNSGSLSYTDNGHRILIHNCTYTFIGQPIWLAHDLHPGIFNMASGSEVTNAHMCNEYTPEAREAIESIDVTV